MTGTAPYRLALAIMLGAGSQAHAAPEPAAALAFSPSSLKLARGQINQVMVLGSPHLSQLPKPFDAATLQVLNERLVAWRPQAVAIESLSGVQCANLLSYPQRYDETFKT